MAAEFVRVVKCLDHGKTQMLKDAQDYTARNLQQTSERDKNKIWKLHNNYQKKGEDLSVQEIPTSVSLFFKCTIKYQGKV